jgi:hypothetical protein
MRCFGRVDLPSFAARPRQTWDVMFHSNHQRHDTECTQHQINSRPPTTNAFWLADLCLPGILCERVDLFRIAWRCLLLFFHLHTYLTLQQHHLAPSVAPISMQASHRSRRIFEANYGFPPSHNDQAAGVHATLWTAAGLTNLHFDIFDNGCRLRPSTHLRCGLALTPKLIFKHSASMFFVDE